MPQRGKALHKAAASVGGEGGGSGRGGQVLWQGVMQQSCRFCTWRSAVCYYLMTTRTAFAASRKSLGVHVVRRCATLAATVTATATATLTAAASSNIKITNKSSAQRGKTKASFVRREKLVKWAQAVEEDEEEGGWRRRRSRSGSSMRRLSCATDTLPDLELFTLHVCEGSRGRSRSRSRGSGRGRCIG